MTAIEWPWQYGFPPFFTLQPNAETRTKQITAWRQLVLEYHSATKQGVLDIREAHKCPLFNNASINRTLSKEGILAVLEDLARTGNADPLDKTKYRWHIYWHTLDEWADIIYQWVQNNGMVKTVCTLYELTSGDTAVGEEFHGLDTDILIKALQKLEAQKKAELIFFDDNQGVKFF
ncbi:vacuolar protein-sorting-associated protein 25 [Anabrus simplex]|uniref:vacuolar protein-sorting-associated protein 25 n=1 Tax=Anabrus simplex TaxID=316456 RepID=UPI0035A34EDA